MAGREEPQQGKAQRDLSRKSDGALVTACLTGSEAAWNALIERYRGLIFHLALAMGLTQTDACDVLQEVSIALVQHLADLRDAGKLKPWLTITTKREVWRILRRHNARANLSEVPLEILTENEWLPDTKTALPEETLLMLEDQVLVRRALDALGPDCRRLLTYLYAFDPPLTYIETAVRMGMPPGSVGAARLRCLKQMRKILAEIGFEE